MRDAFEEISIAARDNAIELDPAMGLTPIAPGVIMFYGVLLNYMMRNHGAGRQRRYIALYDNGMYRIELYEHQNFI